MMAITNELGVRDLKLDIAIKKIQQGNVLEDRGHSVFF